MEREFKQNTRSFSLPPEASFFDSLGDYVASYMRHCGGFKSPLSLVNRAELFLARAFAKLPIAQSMSIVTEHTTPPNWQVLLNYLFTEKVIKSPRFESVRQPNSLPPLVTFNLQAVFDQEKTDGRVLVKPIIGSGTSSTTEESYAKAVGEVLERWVLTIYRRQDIRLETFKSLRRAGHTALDPLQMNGFLPDLEAKHKNYRRSHDTIYGWVKGQELIHNTRAYIPAQAVFWNYKFNPALGEGVLIQPTTNGAAGHYTYERAVLSAVYELIERDGFLIYWLNTISPPILDVSQIGEGPLREMIEKLHQCGLHPIFLDTTTDVGVPSCICVLIDERGDEPFVMVSAATGFGGEDLLLSSLTGAILLVGGYSDVPRFVLPPDYEGPTSDFEVGQKDRINLWKGRDMLEAFRFFISGPQVPLEESAFGKETCQFSSTKEELASLIERFGKLGEGYEIYIYEAKHEILTKLGYHVVQAVVPQLMPMYLREEFATHDSRRLREVPQKLGFIKTTLNPHPHPFP